MRPSSQQFVHSPRRFNSLALYLMWLAAMIGLYSLYARFLVPAIEGPPNIARHEFSAPNLELPSQQFDREKLATLFPPDAWEIGECKVLATAQGLILFKEFQRVDGGYLEVLPFTLVMKESSKPSMDGIEPRTVLRCSKGAKLKFDNPDLDPLTGKSSLESAWLVGEVDIYRPTSSPEKDDSIEIRTSNVQFNERQVFTIDEVHFAFGKHLGSGRQLSMEFAHQQESLRPAGFETIAGFKRIELAYLKRLSLSPKAAESRLRSSDSGQSQASPTVDGVRLGASSDKVEITCTGPFVLDLERKTATFNDQVSVLMDGETKNEILCKRLTVHFNAKNEQSNRSSDPSPDLLNGGSWDPQRLVAEGSPATFLSQTHAARVTGEVLSYNVALQEIVAQPLPQSATPVNIVTPDFRFEAIQVAYKLKPAGGLGELIAIGPGSLLRSGNERNRELFVQWKKLLSIQPEQAQHLVSIVDGCHVRFDKTTEVKSEKMQIWLDESKSENSAVPIGSDPSIQYLPDRMLAIGNVEMVSPQLNGKTERLVATWIVGDNPDNQQTKRIKSSTGDRIKDMVLPVEVSRRQRHLHSSYFRLPSPKTRSVASFGVTSSGTKEEGIRSDEMQSVVQPPTMSISQRNLRPEVRPVDFQEPVVPLKRYSFSGNEFDVKLFSSGEETAVRDLTATGDVTLSEILDPNAKSKRPSMTIKGSQLRYVPQANETARVVVTGQVQQPAMVTTDQFRLQGNQLNFDQAANKLWVEGAGEIEFNPQSLNPGTLPQPGQPGLADGSRMVGQTAYQSVKLSWSSGMVFNGRKVYFEDNVRMLATGKNEAGNAIHTTALGQGISLELNQPIDFGNTQTEAKREIEVSEVVIVNQVAGSQRVFNLARTNLNQSSEAMAKIALISHKTIDTNGLTLEQQQFQAQQVTYGVGTGMVTSKGPGILTHHGTGNSSLLKRQDPEPGNPVDANPLKFAGSDQGISLIRVNFDGSADANVNEKRLLIQGNVRTLYASVASFDQTLDPDQTEALPESAIKVKCDRLELNQWTPRDSIKPVQELRAVGNAHVTSGTFEATADQIRYDQANDTLVVEGTARSDAQLWYHPNASARERQHLVAQKILYRPGDRSYELQLIKNVEMSR